MTETKAAAQAEIGSLLEAIDRTQRSNLPDADKEVIVASYQAVMNKIAEDNGIQIVTGTGKVEIPLHKIFGKDK